MEYIYVFDFGDMVKVGLSIKPSDRLHELERENGVKVIRAFAIKAEDQAKEIERIVHFNLSEYLLLGKEYFSCSFQMARDVTVNVAEQMLGRRVTGLKVHRSKAQQRATSKYNKKAYDRIEIKVKKGQKKKL